MEQINVSDGPRSGKVMNWASILENSTRYQAEMTSTMPFIHPHVALMPDAHLGKGATVGSVIPTKGAIMPAAVGVDIGCGMMAVRTQFTLADLPPRSEYAVLRQEIEARVPVSPGVYNRSIDHDHTRKRIDVLDRLAADYDFMPEAFAGNWELQLGTLGGGNHFIEVSLDEQDRVWLFLHSGSRGVGNKIATHHIGVAQDLCKKWYIDLPDRDLAYLVEGTEEFWTYLKQLLWAQRFAFENRAEMMDRVVRAFRFWVDKGPIVREQEINCHHNYTQKEKHFGKEVWLSRKGAIDASEGKWGLIPGSMGTASYVVTGKGNRLALNSSPHGAGRNYSRKAARGAFSADDLKAAMGDIEYRHSEAFVDEIPQAYKDIDIVMRDAADLVEVHHTLRQIINVKGQ